MGLWSQIFLFSDLLVFIAVFHGHCQSLTLKSQLDTKTIEAVTDAQKALSNKLLHGDNTPSSSSLLNVIVLQPLYFHHGDLFMCVSNLRLTSSEFVVEETNLDVIGHEMMPVVHFPWVKVNGKLKTGKSDTSPQRLDFRVEQKDLQGKGVVSLSANLANVTWAYFFFHPNTSSLEVMSYEDSVGPNTNHAFNVTELGELLAKKLQRGISHELTNIVSKTINQTMSNKHPQLSNMKQLQEVSEISVNNTENANSFFDSLLEVGGEMIRTNFGDHIKIPDIYEWFSEKFVVTFRGSFRAKEGSAVGISSVYRVGDIVLGYDNETLLHFYGIIGFNQLHLYYNYYKAEIWGMGPSGSMDTSFTPISTLVHLNLNLSSKMVTLEKFKIASVGNMDVKLTGLGGVFNWLVSQVTTWVMGLFQDKILRQLESKYEQYGRDIFATYNIEELLGSSVNEAFNL